jgi:N-acetylglucosaminyl-diphospho-decaprenol L-rhamnosyltransferase
MPNRPDVSVVTVGHNTRDLLHACLESIGSSRYVIEVLLVDAGSIDGTAEMVTEQFPAVRLLATGQNLGFTRGNNRALRIARGRYLLLLNPDAVLSPGALEAMVAFLDAQAEVGVVGPQLRFPNGRVQPSRHRFPTPLTPFVDGTVLQRWLGEGRLLAAFYARDRGDDDQQDVDWLRGACLMVRREAAVAVGLFDERFFMYSEEVDLCRRIRAAGWRVVYLPSAVVVHHEGQSSQQNPAARDINFHDSRIRYQEKYFGRSWALALRLAVVANFLFLAAEESGKLLLGHRPELRRQRLQNLRRVIAHQGRRLVAV